MYAFNNDLMKLLKIYELGLRSHHELSSAHYFLMHASSQSSSPSLFERPSPPLIPAGEKRRVGPGGFQKGKKICRDAPLFTLKKYSLLCRPLKFHKSSYSRKGLFASLSVCTQKGHQNIPFQTKEWSSPKTNSSFHLRRQGLPKPFSIDLPLFVTRTGFKKYVRLLCVLMGPTVL